MNNILITGGSGFIGSHLVNTLNDLGYSTSITSRKGENFVDAPIVAQQFTELTWNDQSQVLVHLAAITDTTNHDLEEVMDVNFYRAINLFRNALEAGVNTIVYASSAATYGKYNDTPFRETDATKPLNAYGYSKSMLDDYVPNLQNEYPHARIVGLRFTNVYGGRREQHKKRAASQVWQLYEQMRNNIQPTLFKWGEQRRDFVYVKDVVDAIVRGVTLLDSGIYNVGSGTMRTFNEIIGVLNRCLGTTWQPSYIDNPYTAFYQDGNLLDINKISGYNYFPNWSLEQGVSDMILQDQLAESLIA